MLRKILILFAAIFISSTIFSQSPEKMSYQSVIRDENNALLINQPVGMRVSILQGDLEGTSVYIETHSVNTNANGLASLEIGGGTVLSGVFADIDWASGLYFILTEVDIDGGTNYTITSTSQLMSVPYALYAKNAGNSTPGPQGPAGAGFVDGSISNQMMYWNGLSWTLLNPGIEGQVLSLCNGELVWTNGNCPLTVESLDCSGVIVSGSLNQNIYTDNMLISIPYSGGNGAHYSAISVASTGAEGFTATLSEGDLNTGEGALLFQVSGASTEIGNASFEFSIGNQNCSVSVPVTPLLAGFTDEIYAIGNYFEGGKIAYIFEPGDLGYIEGEVHGIIAAPADQNATLQIGCYWAEIIGADGIAVGTGNQNTIDLENGCTTLGTAAHVCTILNLSGFDDWFLPSLGELEKLYENRIAIGGFANYFYWSSTDYLLGDAMLVSFIDGTSFPAMRDLRLKVRAVRYF